MRVRILTGSLVKEVSAGTFVFMSIQLHLKVGLLGSGEVAQALAVGFLKHGHQVMLGTRNPAKLADWKSQQSDAEVGSFAEAAAFGEMAVLAVKGPVAIDAVRLAGAENLAGKVVMDATNPIADEPPKNGVLTLFTNYHESLMEQLQREFPSTHFVKAFNSVGSALMVNPELKGGPPTMFYCGDDEAAKARVRAIIEQFGWEPADMGKAASARALEPLSILWCLPGFLNNDWNRAFKVLR
jgi:8-hydroxy-5-deazaflavin:NADPH oxidoreductase